MKHIFILLLVVCLACNRNNVTSNPVTPGQSTTQIQTDKAVYRPGETVTFTLNTVPPNSYVRYWHLNTVTSEAPLSGTSWNWQAPATDFRGYLAEVYTKENNTEKTHASIAIDVSSDWSKFPRYGFLSEYGAVQPAKMDSVISALNRYHINGIQFYDWHHKHHQPLAGTVASPSASWKDIANRSIQRNTVQGYIDRAHQAGMKAMFYNLCYGALADGAGDGVKQEWFMFKDAQHTKRDVFQLPNPPFTSDIFFTDPANTSWQQYLANKNNDVYQVYDFDGFHVDQVGDRGPGLYTYNGTGLDLASRFQSFLEGMKAAHPTKRLVMNAVNQYGQQNSIARAPVDFMYTEVWTGHEGYKDLATVIQNNAAYSGGKSTVLAAYVNYKKAESPGAFNTPGVLLANAVIFAFGGSHLELGEHMLGKEYFPNNNLAMNDDLQKAIVVYYDFLTAFQNLLRDGGDFNNITVTCTNGKFNTASWPPQSGKVAVQGKKVGEKQVLHFINMANATSFDWRDTNGTQPAPASFSNAELEVSVSGSISKVWVASPDLNHGLPQALEFTRQGDKVKFTLPQLKYWDMVVME